ncbi:MAG TPA: hypothetical protein VLV87_11100, partial [Gammaproteobacteria bacterium]|nr:hypothetical protein [Gammaproteobacteria bacterium]
MTRRLLLVCTAFILVTGPVIAAAEAPASTTPAPAVTARPAGLDVVAAYAGVWQSDIQYLDTPYSKRYDARYQLRNDCWRSAGFYACNQFVDGASKALVVFMYDPLKGYSSYPIPAEGAGAVHPGRISIEGKVWTFPWQVKKDGKTTYFHVVNTWTSQDRIEFRQEY